MLNYYQTRIYGEIQHEVTRQIMLQKQGRFVHTPKDPGISDFVKFGILSEEYGEVARCVLANAHLVQEGASMDSLRKELVQVAAIAVAWLESPKLQ